MSSPVGGIAFYRPRYGSTKDAVTGGVPGEPCIVDALGKLARARVGDKFVENPYKKKHAWRDIDDWGTYLKAAINTAIQSTPTGYR